MDTSSDARPAQAGTEVPGGTLGSRRTVASYFGAFSPAPSWDELVAWPPDVFALANLILDHTQSYRFAVAPPASRRWPPTPDWNERVVAAAARWWASTAEPGADLPELVNRCWQVVLGSRDVELTKVATGADWELCEALLTLHATADEACAWLSAPATPEPCAPCEDRAWTMLQKRGSLSRISPARVRVIPKGHFASRGITIRSLSRYMALCYESVDVHWNRVGPDGAVAAALAGRQGYSVLLIPWPLSVKAGDFRPVPNPLGNMNPDAFGFFEFAPSASLDVAHVRAALDAACAQNGKLDAIIMPEAALEPSEIGAMEEALDEHAATFLIAGVREPPAGGVFGRNYLHFGVRTAHGWARDEQDKHHRWSLDGSQIRQYHLTRSLDPRKLWWEAVDIRPRTLHVTDFGGGATTAPLVCEDLARMDEVADLLRRIGPSVVIALLLDGPQLVTRWPYRYASVLSEEPGSAVLTLTSLGMAARSRPPGTHTSRVVALWNSPADGLREIKLERGADAVAITLSVGSKTVWTADGRRHADVPNVMLGGVRQVRGSAGGLSRPHRRLPAAAGR